MRQDIHGVKKHAWPHERERQGVFPSNQTKRSYLGALTLSLSVRSLQRAHVGESPMWSASARGLHAPNGDIPWNDTNACVELTEVVRQSGPAQAVFIIAEGQAGHRE